MIVRIINAEFKYSFNALVAILIICLSYSLLIIMVKSIFDRMISYYYEFWTWIVGVSSFFLMTASIIDSRKNENRDRFHTMLPLKLAKISRSRIISILNIPVIFMLYLLIINIFLLPEGSKASLRIIAFMSKGYVVLSAAAILWDLWFCIPEKKNLTKISIVISAIVLIILFLILVSIIVDPFINKLIGGGNILVALIAGSFLAYVDSIIFLNRKSYIS